MGLKNLQHTTLSLLKAKPSTPILTRKPETRKLSGHRLQQVRKWLFVASPFCSRCTRIINLDSRKGELGYFEVDHVIPLFYGGTDDLQNLQILCYDCHQEKTLEDFEKYGRPKGAQVDQNDPRSLQSGRE